MMMMSLGCGIGGLMIAEPYFDLTCDTWYEEEESDG